MKNHRLSPVWFTACPTWINMPLPFHIMDKGENTLWPYSLCGKCHTLQTSQLMKIAKKKGILTHSLVLATHRLLPQAEGYFNSLLKQTLWSRLSVADCLKLYYWYFWFKFIFRYKMGEFFISMCFNWYVWLPLDRQKRVTHTKASLQNKIISLQPQWITVELLENFHHLDTYSKQNWHLKTQAWQRSWF